MNQRKTIIDILRNDSYQQPENHTCLIETLRVWQAADNKAWESMQLELEARENEIERLLIAITQEASENAKLKAELEALRSAPPVPEVERLRTLNAALEDKYNRVMSRLLHIVSFVSPDNVTLPDGRVFEFNNPEVEHEMLQRLSKAIKDTAETTDGYVLVPKEPTTRMSTTYYNILEHSGTKNFYPVWCAILESVATEEK